MTYLAKCFTIVLCFSALLLPRLYAQEKQHSLLWEISGNGLAKPSYLFGTIHAICPKDFVMNQSIEQSVTKSSQVYLELDMDEPSMMMDMQKMMFMPEGTTLKSLMKEGDYQLVAQFFKDSIGINVDKVQKLKPFALSSMTVMKMLNCPIKSYEMTFVEMAKAQKKEVLGLETVEEQMSAIDKMGYEQQADLMLVKMVKNWNTDKNTFGQMIKDYKSQNLEGLLKDMTSSSTMDVEFEKNLLNDRNKNWVPRIKKVIHEKSTFFAVGAGHLPGENGVINLLRKEGYIVKAVVK